MRFGIRLVPGQNFHMIAVLKLVIQRNDRTVHFRALAAVAHIRVNRISKIHGR